MSCTKFRAIKPEIRVLGVDDGMFVPHTKGLVPVIGVIFRGGYWLDGVLCTKVEVDGLDATDKIVSMIIQSAHLKQLRVIMLSGVTCAGFNIIDLAKLNMDTGLPAIAVTREKPNLNEIRTALKNLPNFEEKWKIIQSIGNLFQVPTRHNNARVYAQACGITEEDTRKIIRLTSTRSYMPEPLRVAHLIASGLGLNNV